MRAVDAELFDFVTPAAARLERVMAK